MADSISIPGETNGDASENPAITPTQAPKVAIFSVENFEKLKGVHKNIF